MRPAWLISAALFLAAGLSTVRAGIPSARAFREEGRHAAAFDAYRLAILGDGAETNESLVAQGILDAARSARAVRRIGAAEAFLDDVRRQWITSFPVRLACIQATDELPDTGRLVDGVFTRGGDPAPFSCRNRDRVRLLRELESLMPAVASANRIRRNWYWRLVKDLLLDTDDVTDAGRLDELTDLSRDPDVKRNVYDLRPYPFAADGTPYFPELPASWAAAKTDGERWRWALDQWAAVDAERARRAALDRAAFVKTHFGPQRLPFDLVRTLPFETLADDELFYFRDGAVHRLRLPSAFDRLKLLVDAAAWSAAGDECLLRRQCARAVGFYRRVPKPDDALRRKIDQIVRPLVRIEPCRPGTTARPFSFELTFRNATNVVCSLAPAASGVPLPSPSEAASGGSRLSRPQSLDWHVPLRPLDDHRDSRVTLAAPRPLPAGDYRLSVQAAEGNRAEVAVRISALTIVDFSRRAAGGDVFVVDAETGAPAVGATLARTLRRDGPPDAAADAGAALPVDADGSVRIAPDPTDPLYGPGRTQFTATRGDAVETVPGGRFAGWLNGAVDPGTRSLVAPDRPLYRPGDTVHLDIWRMRPARTNVFDRIAGAPVDVTVTDPDGVTLTIPAGAADAFGAATCSLTLAASARSGTYAVAVGDEPAASGSFTVVAAPSDGETGVPVSDVAPETSTVSFDSADWTWLYGRLPAPTETGVVSALELTCDRTDYAPGETARISVRTVRPDAFVFYKTRAADPTERMKIVRTVDGRAKIAVPVTAGDSPNVHIFAWTVFSGYAHHAVCELRVPPATRIGHAEIDLPATARPGETVDATVRLFDPSGRPAHASGVLTVYDDALDACRDGQTVPPLRERFWGWKRDSNVSLRASCDTVSTPVVSADGTNLVDLTDIALFGVDRFAVAPAAFATRKGTDRRAASVRAAGRPRRAFPQSVYRAVLSASDGDVPGVYRVKMTLPDVVASWRLRVRAVGADGCVAETSVRFAARKDVSVRLDMPSSLVEGDEPVVSAVVSNATTRPFTGPFRFSVDTDLVDTLSPVARDITVPAGGTARVDLRLRARRAGELAVSAAAEGVWASDTATRRVRIRVPEASFAAARSSADDPYAGRSPQAIVARALAYLQAHTGETTEDLVLGFAPALTVRSLLPAFLPARAPSSDVTDAFAVDPVDAAVRDGLARLRARQLPDGGWDWLPGEGGRACAYSTAVAVQGLLDAHDAGAELPDGVLPRALSWLAARQRAALVRLRGSSAVPTAQDALTAYLLNRADSAVDETSEMMNRLYDAREGLPFYAKCLLARALALSGESERFEATARACRRLLRQDAADGSVAFELDNAGSWWRWYGDDAVSSAAGLDLLLETDASADEIEAVARTVAGRFLGEGRCRSTRAVAAALSALTRFFAQTGTVRQDFARVAAAASRTPATDVLRLTRSVSRLADGKTVPLAADDVVTAGDLLEVRLELVAADAREELVVENPVPAGCVPDDGADACVSFDGCRGHVRRRDGSVAVYLRELPSGTSVFTYRLRADKPGVYVVPPATVRAVQAPDRLRTSTDRARLTIVRQ